ncbi:MAG: threonine/serine dehydratase [Chloroflexota bacterium]|nr:threonine/serine dehydratase [Chloroflexota bacterium]MDE2886416.1 threonine/serine dehydratase [Chloroflexota bacterium]
MQPPTMRDVYEARKTIAPYLARTPLQYSAGLSRVFDADVYLKHEEHHPLGAYKIRGGINLLAHMGEEERSRGLITASTGNHGQSIAFACRMFGAKALIALPAKDPNPVKVAAMEALGAELVFHGDNFDEARAHCERLAAEEGYRYVHAVNEPLLIAGVATQALEIIEELPDVEVLYVPLGGGTEASGACIVTSGIAPDVKVRAVQSEAAPAGYLSWQRGELVQASMNTFAEGIATVSGYELPQQIIRHVLDDFVLVSDDEIRHAMGMLIQEAHTLSEGAGAAATAGAYKQRESLAGRKVSITVSGANTTAAQLSAALETYARMEG